MVFYLSVRLSEVDTFCATSSPCNHKDWTHKTMRNLSGEFLAGWWGEPNKFTASQPQARGYNADSSWAAGPSRLSLFCKGARPLRANSTSWFSSSPPSRRQPAACKHAGVAERGGCYWRSPSRPPLRLAPELSVTRTVRRDFGATAGSEAFVP